MPPQAIADLQSAIPQILEQVPYLRLLVLFGSRARGDHFPSSDWDFALLFDEELRQQYEPGDG
ncbi:MAG: nucleotidyltransferase domain-containing protein, partial [Leptolyngbyaceae cyanobacterium CAN_BIN12]|nr:nucleotidyltransferase domain-containing protein [Leptolyngbyaceae cyanobacterium CAN_BIN12]